MRSRYQIIRNSGVYFTTSTIIEWIPVFTKKEYFDIVVQSLSYCRQNKGLKLFAYVVMDNHVHLIKRRLVEQAEHWVYSSARNYVNGEGCIEIDLIET